MSKLITAYRFDPDGYYMGKDQVMEGILPRDDTLLAPENREGYWPRFIDGQWAYEKIPATAEDFVEAGIIIDHQSHTPHTEALREIIRSVATTEREAGKLALNQDSKTNNLSVVRVPELTDAETALQADEVADDNLTQKINDLKDQMTCAMLMGDDEWISELRAEYKALMEV